MTNPADQSAGPPTPEGTPRERERRCRCGHLRSKHGTFESGPMPCYQGRCACGHFLEAPAPRPPEPVRGSKWAQSAEPEKPKPTFTEEGLMEPDTPSAEPGAEAMAKAAHIVDTWNPRQEKVSRDWLVRRVALALEAAGAAAWKAVEAYEQRLRASEAARDNALNEAAESIRTALRHFQKRKEAEAAVEIGTRQNRALAEAVESLTKERDGWRADYYKAQADRVHSDQIRDAQQAVEIRAARAEATKAADQKWEPMLRRAISRCICEGLPWCGQCQVDLAAIRAPRQPDPRKPSPGPQPPVGCTDSGMSASPPPPSEEPRPLCGRQNRAGWYCGLLEGHGGDHEQVPWASR